MEDVAYKKPRGGGGALKGREVKVQDGRQEGCKGVFGAGEASQEHKVLLGSADVLW